MSIKIISSYSDSEWESYSDVFYNNFNPDDWDYFIMGDDKYTVELLAEKLYICYYELKEIDGCWMAVTYHS